MNCTSNWPLLSIEYVEGDTLDTVVARHIARAHLRGGHGLPAMPLLRAWYYFQQLLGAIAAIHALGIVHRDVKPSNILVRLDGLVKLSDFGIARFSDAPTTAATRELAPGTGTYMSPEQVLSRPLDGRSDLYSAAIVLYEMLAGRPPFLDDQGEFSVRKAQVETPPPPIRAYLPQAPPIVDALFARALAKEPAFRFESAIEMGDFDTLSEIAARLKRIGNGVEEFLGPVVNALGCDDRARVRDRNIGPQFIVADFRERECWGGRGAGRRGRRRGRRFVERSCIGHESLLCCCAFRNSQ